MITHALDVLDMQEHLHRALGAGEGSPPSRRVLGGVECPA